MLTICKMSSPDYDTQKSTMSKELNNPAVVAMEIPTGLTGQSTNFIVVEDLIVTMAYSQASEDSISGAKQKGHIFKSTIESVYKSILLEQEEKELHDASHPSYLHETDGVEPVPYPRCSGHSVHTRFLKNIFVNIHHNSKCQ